MKLSKRITALFLSMTFLFLLTSCQTSGDSTGTTVSATTVKYDDDNWYDDYDTSSADTLESSDSLSDAESQTGDELDAGLTAVNNTNSDTAGSPTTNSKGNTVSSSTANGVQVLQKSTTTSVSSSAATSTKTSTTTVPEEQVTRISLKDNSISISGSGAEKNGNVLTINSAGDFIITGTLTNGQILVDALKTESIRIALNGVHIDCSYSAPFYIKSADKVLLTLVSGVTNSFTDSASSGASLPNACIYSNEDITINGEGSLTVELINAYVDGIYSNNDLRLTNGTVTVIAGYDGFEGVDSVHIYAGTLTVTAGNDGIKASNEDDAGEGHIVIEGGTIEVVAEDDAVSAVSSVLIEGGKTLLVSGSVGDGIKALNSSGTIGTISVTGGLLYIDAGDDLLNAAQKNTVSGCTIYTKYGGKRTKSNDTDEKANIDYTCFIAWNGVFNGWN